MQQVKSTSDKESKKHEAMMRQGREVQVVIQGYDGATAPGELRIQEWNKGERTLRALKFGGACWGIAIVSIILPILHFVLVPGFLLAGPIVLFVVLGQEAVVLGGKGTCPSCKKDMKIVRCAPRFPLSDVCEHCRNGVKIELTVST